MLELADIDLSDEGGDVLVVLVAGFRFRDRDLPQFRGVDPRHFELGNVAAELVESLDGPRADDAGQAMALDAVTVGEQRPELFRAEESKGGFEYRTDVVASLENIDGKFFHQVLQPFGERGLAAADRTEQVKYLPPFLEPLRRMFEIADDALDRVLHSEEPVEGAVDLDRTVVENTAEAGILRGVDELGLSDREIG